MDEQRQNLRRVADAIAPTIAAFIDARIGETFTMSELQAHVAARHPSAPDSPSRILRMLKQGGRVNYVVENRRQSRYRALPVEVVT